MSQNGYVYNQAPINIISVGGFLSVNYLKNRATTEDLDYLLEPKWAKNEKIKVPLQNAINAVAEEERLEFDWMNEDMALWTNTDVRETIFQKAVAQNIVLFEGQAIKVYAGPFDWALENKLRRLAFSHSKKDKTVVDTSDALHLFKHFRDMNRGPLDMEHYRRLNTNGFDPELEPRHMESIAAKYRDAYKEELFTTSIAQSISHPPVPAEASGSRNWSDWLWTEQHECWYRCRQNSARPDGYEYEYMSASAPARARLSQPAERVQETLPQPAELVQEKLPNKYYSVRDGQYYYTDEGNVVALPERPENVWVYNENGWKDTQRQKKWRLSNGGKTEYS